MQLWRLAVRYVINRRLKVNSVKAVRWKLHILLLL